MKFHNLFLLLLMIILAACYSSIPTATPADSEISSSELPSNATPDAFPVTKNSFGDGYVAHILIDDARTMSNEEVVRSLVSQWLEHYKSNSSAERAMIKDYQVGEITLLERLPGEPMIVASVRFSIIPGQIPNDWASFPGDPIDPDNPWWRLVAPVGVYKGDTYYSLGLLFGRGT